MSFTVYVCPTCGATFTEPYQSHGKRGDYPAGRRPECGGALEAVEVVPRAVADELAGAVEAAPNTITAREAVREYREKV